MTSRWRAGWRRRSASWRGAPGVCRIHGWARAGWRRNWRMIARSGSSGWRRRRRPIANRPVAAPRCCRSSRATWSRRVWSASTARKPACRSRKLPPSFSRKSGPGRRAMRRYTRWRIGMTRNANGRATTMASSRRPRRKRSNYCGRRGQKSRRNSSSTTPRWSGRTRTNAWRCDPRTSPYDGPASSLKLRLPMNAASPTPASEAGTRKRTSRRKKFLGWTLGVAGFLLALLLTLLLGKDAIVKSIAERRIRQLTGFTAHIGQLKAGFGSVKVAVKDFQLFNPPEFGGRAVFDIPELFMELDAAQLAGGKVHFRNLRRNLAQVKVIKAEDEGVYVSKY